MNINGFYNKKCKELGWEDFGDFLDRMTVANIRDCVFLWTKEYANIVNGQTKQPEKALVINGVGSTLDLGKLQKKIDEILDGATKEELQEYINKKG